MAANYKSIATICTELLHSSIDLLQSYGVFWHWQEGMPEHLRRIVKSVLFINFDFVTFLEDNWNRYSLTQSARIGLTIYIWAWTMCYCMLALYSYYLTRKRNFDHGQIMKLCHLMRVQDLLILPYCVNAIQYYRYFSKQNSLTYSIEVLFGLQNLILLLSLRTLSQHDGFLKLVQAKSVEVRECHFAYDAVHAKTFGPKKRFLKTYNPYRSCPGVWKKLIVVIGTFCFPSSNIALPILMVLLFAHALKVSRDCTVHRYFKMKVEVLTTWLLLVNFYAISSRALGIYNSFLVDSTFIPAALQLNCYALCFGFCIVCLGSSAHDVDPRFDHASIVFSLYSSSLNRVVYYIDYLMFEPFYSLFDFNKMLLVSFAFLKRKHDGYGEKSNALSHYLYFKLVNAHVREVRNGSSSRIGCEALLELGRLCRKHDREKILMNPKKRRILLKLLAVRAWLHTTK